VVDFDLSGTTVLVTGATKGIGYGVARQMLQAGANVALTSRTPTTCETTAAALNEEFGAGRALGVVWDLADLDGLQPLLDTVVNQWGQIDALVGNAADTGRLGPVESVTGAGFARLLQTNVVNNFVLARSVAGAMVERGYGSITFITSIAASTPMPSNVPYAAAKSALLSMARSLAGEYAGTGVRVNCVAPGLIRTHSSRAVWENEEFEHTFVGAHIPMKRIGEAEEVGSACVFLASSAGAYITAASIPVDGGRSGLGQITGSPQLTRVQGMQEDR
jgi:NAD(P)-dependent dehydrogenase (short-subunit alcohol dehydrogenase family)